MRNVTEMKRMGAVVRRYLKDGKGAAVRITRRNLVKATPKRTQFAARWNLGVGGPPAFVPLGKPAQPLYPLIGDAETDAEMASAGLGADIVLLSSATYIKWLDVLGNSPQADAGFVEAAISKSATDFKDWKWKGLAA